MSTWLLGDSSSGLPEERTYVWQPLVSEGVLRWTGLLGLVVLGLALEVARRVRAIRPALTFSICAGALLGFGHRTFTAGVGGANIGAGLFELLGVPVVVVLALAALVLAVQARPLRSRAGARSAS